MKIVMDARVALGGHPSALPKGYLIVLVFSLVFTFGMSVGVTGKAVQHDPGTPMPSFSEPIGNITIIKGRDITFTCVVKHLGQYKVGWVKADTKAIQAIHHQVVTHNPRVSVTYRDRTTWNLHIRDVQEDDRGIYMCQVNTDPMIAEMSYLEVVVPPEIVDNETSGETEIEEGSSVTLVCKARGYPAPEVSWKREGGVNIVLRDRDVKLADIKGVYLNLTRVRRTDMGPYLCIATNGIPPSVSKRIMLRVNFPPTVEVPEHMIGSPLGSNVTIRCIIQSFPRSVNTWRHEPNDQMIISSHKYNVSEVHEGYYITRMTLVIYDFSKVDATRFKCMASNSLGPGDSVVQVYEIPPQKPPTKEKDNSRQENHIPNTVPESDHKNKLAFNNDVTDNEIETYVDPPGRYPPKNTQESHPKVKDSPKKPSSGGLGILLPGPSHSSVQVNVSKGWLVFSLLLSFLLSILPLNTC